MKVLLPVIVAAAGLYAADAAIDGATYVREVAPREAVAGTTVIAYGENLNAERVFELYLTDGKLDFKVEILEQSKHEIHFRVPAEAAAGKLRLVLVMHDQMMLEQPAFLRVIKAPGPVTGG